MTEALILEQAAVSALPVVTWASSVITSFGRCRAFYVATAAALRFGFCAEAMRWERGTAPLSGSSAFHLLHQALPSVGKLLCAGSHLETQYRSHLLHAGIAALPPPGQVRPRKDISAAASGT